MVMYFLVFASFSAIIPQNEMKAKIPIRIFGNNIFIHLFITDFNYCKNPSAVFFALDFACTCIKVKQFVITFSPTMEMSYLFVFERVSNTIFIKLFNGVFNALGIFCDSFSVIVFCESLNNFVIFCTHFQFSLIQINDKFPRPFVTVAVRFPCADSSEIVFLLNFLMKCTDRCTELNIAAVTPILKFGE